MKSAAAAKPNHLLLSAREQRNLSRAEVARQLETNPFTVYRWERGITRPSSYFRRRLCALFEMAPAQLGLVAATAADHLPTVIPLYGDSAADTGSVPPAERQVYVPPPGLLTDLVGRGKDLQALCDLFRAAVEKGLSPSVALYGLPGIGKTALACAVTQALQDAFPDGLLWAGLGPHAAPYNTLTTWAQALSLPQGEITAHFPLDQYVQIVRQAVGQKRLLLVLDDVWQLEDALALRIGGPRCGHLLTTRLPLIAAQFAPLHTRHVQDLSLDDSVQLLTTYAPIAIAQDNQRATALAQTVGGLPLALSLMGHYLHQESMSAQPRRIMCAFARLEDALARLRLEQAYAPAERPPSVPTHTSISLSRVIEVSYVRLSSAAQTLLKRLALLPAKPQTVSETLAIHMNSHADPQSIQIIDELADTGLLESAGAHGYTLHQTIADFVRSLLSADERRREEKRIAKALVTFAEQRASIQATTRDTEPSRYQQEVGLAVTDHELQCLHYALTLAAQYELHDELARGALTLADTWQTRGYYATGAQHLRRAVASARQLQDGAPLVALLISLGGMERGRGRTYQADACLEEALQAAQGIQDEHLLCNLLEAEGMRFVQQRRHREAEAAFRACLQQAECIGYQQQVRWQLINLGWMAHLLSDDSQSAAYYSDGAARARAAQDWDTYGRCVERLGALASAHGEYQQADVLLRESLEIVRQGQNWHYLWSVLGNLGEVALALGQGKEAQGYFSESLSLARTREGPYHLCLSLLRMADYACFAQEWEEAERNLEEADTLCERLPVSDVHGIALAIHAIFLAHAHDIAKATEYAAMSIAISRKWDDRWLLSSHLSLWGRYALEQGDIDQAATAYTEAATIGEAIASQDCLGHASFGLARVALARGDRQKARKEAQIAATLLHSSGHHALADLDIWRRQVRLGNVTASSRSAR